MKTSKRRGITVAGVVAVLALSGVAMAASDEGNDTVFNYGYDEDNHFFMWNVTSLEYEPDFQALAEALFEDFDAILEACGLQGLEEEDPVVYDYTFDGEAITLVGAPPETTDCGELIGGYVTGPQGQINHGKFVSLFNALYVGPRRGCLVRHIAQSDLGKGEQQVHADPLFIPSETPEPITDGTVSFTTIAADCHNEKKGGGDDETGGGPPQHVLDKWGEDGPGNSGNAKKNRP